MNENFDRCIEWLLRPDVEGKFSDDPDDPGGLTKWGIAARSHPEVINPNFSREDAVDIYRVKYWDKAHSADLSWPYDLLIFDMAVNMGCCKIPIKILQRALGVLDDGVFGEKTRVRLILTKGDPELVLDIMSHRQKYY